MVGMNRTNVGPVQVKYNGTWGAMCVIGFHFSYWSAAEVICRQLGQGPPLKHNFLSKECPMNTAIQGIDIIWLSELVCYGFEDSISQCTHGIVTKFDAHDCKPCKDCLLCLLCQSLGPNTTSKIKSLLFFLCFFFHLSKKKRF